MRQGILRYFSISIVMFEVQDQCNLSYDIPVHIFFRKKNLIVFLVSKIGKKNHLYNFKKSLNAVDKINRSHDYV